MLPLVPRQKRPLTETGLLEASVDTATITEWWTRWPSANIGLRTGVQFDVLDIDGEVGTSSLSAKMGPEKAHSGPISRTGKGEHWLFLPTGTANQAGLLDKVDWRGTNGYIVAPPSIHPDGHSYAWHPEQGPDAALTSPPDWLRPMLTQWVEKDKFVERPISVLRTQPYSKHSPQRLLTFDAERLANLKEDIVAMAEQLGYEPRRHGGNRYVIRCPFHPADDTPSLVLYTHNNSFYCFGCGAWGDALNLKDNRPGGHRA